MLNLQKQADQVRDLQSKLAGEIEAFDRKTMATTAALDKREKAVREREVQVTIRKNAIMDANAIRARDAEETRRLAGFRTSPQVALLRRNLHDRRSRYHRTRRHRINGAGRSTAPAAARIDTGSSV